MHSGPPRPNLMIFAGAQNMVISSTRFQHRNIHKATWQSSYLNTKNQIDHIMIDGRHFQASLTCAHFGAPTWTSITSLSQPSYAHVSAHATTHANQCRAGLSSRSCDHNRLLNRCPLAFRNFLKQLSWHKSARDCI